MISVNVKSRFAAESKHAQNKKMLLIVFLHTQLTDEKCPTQPFSKDNFEFFFISQFLSHLLYMFI